MKVVVLDRDGVINHDSDNYIKSAEEWLPIDGSIDAIATLSKSGYQVMVATNQSGLGRNYFDEYALAKMHTKLCTMVEEAGGIVDGIFYCPHTPDQNCECRKPKTGLLKQIESEFSCSLSGSCFIGDSYGDIQAALAFGCEPILVRTGKGLITEQRIQKEGLSNISIFDNLASAVLEKLVVHDNV
ncbi:MAG: D-glycero-beta-D-manno-heptose-1,7-bisphosphate 7-phosphatase [SAR86 cluster bacterium]|uniref:D,D-heptose 1,7-bisphosphate phosphatase n=1 Tax=SAR86 cluster bacterium TaxID=2030880 RepID=A0A2A5AYI8_9GAMM|nr:MAG: D-glycero-beta-D-manno-heptose-1,7-bisphosphate 7-phosphatase [SAR86 cluster bacterium]